jgi:hypothetical protein
VLLSIDSFPLSLVLVLFFLLPLSPRVEVRSLIASLFLSYLSKFSILNYTSSHNSNCKYSLNIQCIPIQIVNHNSMFTVSFLTIL